MDFDKREYIATACHPFNHFYASWHEDQRPKNGKGDVGFSQG